MRVKVENLPSDLRREGRACPYRLVPKIDETTGEVEIDQKTGKMKYGKPPFRALPGSVPCQKNDPTHFTTVDEAIAAQERYGYDGIGISPGFSGVVAGDLDGCLDENGKPNELAEDVMASLTGAYFEVSPSGRGLRIIFKVDKDFRYDRGRYRINNRTIGMEFYYSAPGDPTYFVTLTGNALSSVETLPNLTGSFVEVLEKYMPRPGGEKKNAAEVAAEIAEDDRDPDTLAMDAQEVYDRIARSRDAEAFEQLRRGERAGKPSDSEADLYFCGIATFYSQKDAALVDYMFRESERSRDKWDSRRGGSTYGELTIGRAFADHKTVWDPDYNKKQTAPLVYDDPFSAFGFYSVPDLTEEERRPPEFIIDGMLPVGMTFLSGAPKTRKSFLALQMAIAVATGQAFWDHAVTACDVAYLDLEGSKSRAYNRMKEMITEMPRNIYVTNSTTEKLADGLVEKLRQLHRQRPNIRLIIIDTFSRARGSVKTCGANAYDADVALLEPVQRMALEENIAVLFVHHDKKGAALVGDSFERLSGTMGISGSADCVINLITEGKRFDGKEKLECTPRDAKSFEAGIYFDELLMSWTMEARTDLAKDLLQDPLCSWLIRVAPEQGRAGVFYSYEAAY